MKEIVEFLETRWTNQIIEQFLDRIDLRILQIQKNPELAPLIENTQFHQLLIHETTSVFYKNHPNHIKILLVWDNRQDSSNLLEKLRISNN